MEIGIDSFATAISDAATGLVLNPVERMHHLFEEIEPPLGLVPRNALACVNWTSSRIVVYSETIQKPRSG